MEKMISREIHEILNQVRVSKQKVLTESAIQSLPRPVQKWLKTTGAIGKSEINTAFVKQRAWMKLKPKQQKWYTAKAIQYVTTGNPAFIWTVKMKMSPIIKIKGRDKLVNGKGEMLIKLNGLIPVVNEKGEKINEGSLQRYLGELVWYPSAATNQHIQWDAIDDFSAKATITHKGTTGSGIFYFNEQGDVVKFSALRFMGNKPGSKRLEWIITVNDYAVFEGIKVPAKMEASWKLEKGEWTWLKLEIDEIKYNITHPSTE